MLEGLKPTRRPIRIELTTRAQEVALMASAEETQVKSRSPSNGVDVIVTDLKIRNQDKARTVYKIELAVGNEGTYGFRRYSECLAFLDKIKAQVPEVAADSRMKLPDKKSAKKSSKSRRQAIRDLVKTLTASHALRQHPTVRTFLNLDSKRRQSSTSEEESDEAYDSPPERHGSTSSTESGQITLGPLEKNSVKPGDFEFLKVIGKGSFGKVLLARHKTEDTLYAVKVLEKSHIIRKNEVQHIMAERNVLIQSISHPFLVGLHYAFQTAERLYFVLDYINGGELFFHMQREKTFSESRSRFYAAEIASALGYLHSLNIIYRDLKPENILLDCEGHVRLTDFGLCKEGIAAKTTTTTFCGTPEYLAPEILEKKPYDRTVDWWCLGAVLYELIFGLPPFYSRAKSEMYENTLKKPLTFRQTAVVSSEAKDVIQKLLEKDKSRRLGACFDFLEIKNHVFFGPIDWIALNQRAITPPFVPDLSGKWDLKNIDPDFVQEPIPASIENVVNRPRVTDRRLAKTCAEAFYGFSYVKPNKEVFQL